MNAQLSASEWRQRRQAASRLAWRLAGLALLLYLVGLCLQH